MIMRTTFNDLCADLLLELFSYFTVEEIFESFSLLILNLEQFLIDYNVRLHLRSINTLSRIDPKQVVSVDIPDIFSYAVIHSEERRFCGINDLLKGSLSWLPRSFNLISPEKVSGITHCLHVDRFVNLHSITIRDVDNRSIFQIFDLFSHLSAPIEHVSLIFTGNSYRSPVSQLFPLIYTPSAMSNWKRFDLSMSHYDIRLSDIENLNTIQLILEHLVWNTNCTIGAIQHLLGLLPRLKTLRVNLIPNLDFQYIPISTDLNLPLLYSIDLIWHHIDFNCILEIIQCAPNLRRCHLKGQGHSDHKQVVKSDIWILLLEQQIKLKSLKIKMAIFGGDQSVSMINQFRQSLFFQKVNFKLESTSTSEWDIGWLNLTGDFQR